MRAPAAPSAPARPGAPRAGRARPAAGALLAFALSLAALAAALFAAPAALAYEPPPIDGHVTDAARKLNQTQRRALNDKLDDVRRQTGFEVAVLLAPSLEGETIEDVAYATFNAWKLGQKGQDNGVLLVIAPAERRVRIETGKGVGGDLTDLESNDIIRNHVAPYLKQDRFFEAVDEGTNAIVAKLTKGQYNPGPSKARPPARQPRSRGASGVGVFVTIALVVLINLFLRRRGGGWFFFWPGGGGWGGGGGGFGGGGGGGFSGGGGGESGGGGSSDSY
ncbi:MAG TPA: TPM domain-containing protein [Polyangiaceae bacterium]|nr:TPM domain-containing protein [Polyangiaceae bacterium]